MHPQPRTSRGDKPESKSTKPPSSRTAAPSLDQLINDYVADEAEVIAAREAAIKRVLHAQTPSENRRKTK